MPPVPQQHWQLAAQQPTATRIRIRSVEDAHKIFYAVRKGVLRMVTRRLDSDERAALCTGCVYAWEERSPNTEITGLGIERFTEGRRWSASRVRDVCPLFSSTLVDIVEFSHRNFCSTMKSSSLLTTIIGESGGRSCQVLTHALHSSGGGGATPVDWEQLVKQTYSVWVDTEKGKRKWHLSTPTNFLPRSSVDFRVSCILHAENCGRLGHG